MKDSLIQIGGNWYIDPVQLLKYLDSRVRLLGERIAVPGTEHVLTESLRARRLEIQDLQRQFKEHSK